MKLSSDFKEVSRLTVFGAEMQQKTVAESKFLQFNNNRFYVSDGITPLPLSYLFLKELVEFKTRWAKE